MQKLANFQVEPQMTDDREFLVETKNCHYCCNTHNVLRRLVKVGDQLDEFFGLQEEKKVAIFDVWDFYTDHAVVIYRKFVDID